MGTSVTPDYRRPDGNAANKLSSEHVELWCVPIHGPDSTVQTFEKVLSVEEVIRADRFLFPEHRRSFVIARGILRHLLASYAAVSPSKLRFSYGDQGKPSLGGEIPVCFNLSHSGDLGLFAFTMNRELGVDIEQHRRMVDLEQIARHFFSEGEVRDLLSLNGPVRETAFYRCWTRKEAFVKAVGEGLSIPLHNFRVALLPAQPASLVELPAKHHRRWTMYDVSPCDGYSAAIVVEGNPIHLNRWNVTQSEWVLRF
jgi:4'-phosphopantetheinyl transferase